MKIMIIGGGGREHALAWKLAQSDHVEEIIAVPGNPGIAREPKCRCVGLADYDAMADFAKEQNIDLTVVGPEAPLVDGIADRFRSLGLAVFGPGSQEAQLEGSKQFSKAFMEEFGVATARFQSFDELGGALEYIRHHPYPLVVKASGICAGKGVTICLDQAQAEAALQDLMVRSIFQTAGQTVVIEECLTGPEVSVLAIYDGETIHPMISAMDHKRAHDGDEGPNTGGMGTIAPAPAFHDAARQDFFSNILEPTREGLKARGMTDPACIFFGLMLTPDGARLLEYNMRFGDPETQSVLSLLESDLALILRDAARGRLEPSAMQFSDETALCIIGAAQGYPGSYVRDIPLVLPEEPGIKVFLAGAREQSGELFSAGGRIFGATATGEIHTVRQRLLAYMDHFKDQPIFWRSDIGAQAIQPESQK